MRNKVEIKMETRTMEVTAKAWEKNGQSRIYFNEVSSTRNAGKACWDVSKGEWVKVRGEFGPKIKAIIKKEMGL